MTPAQRADVAYIRQAKTACQPSWWRQAKANTASTFRPALWGRIVPMTFEPGPLNLKVQVTSTIVGTAVFAITVSWPPGDLSDTSPAGQSATGDVVTKADLANLTVWTLLGRAAALSALPPQTFTAMSRQNNTRLQQYLEFGASLTVLYYASPPARRAALAGYLTSFLPKRGAEPLGGPRRAAGALFLATVLADPARFPSLPLPATLPADRPEEQLAAHYKFKIGPPWTIAEEKLLRQAVEKFLKTNDAAARDEGVVALPNGLLLAFDPTADEPLRVKRDKWVKDRFDKAASLFSAAKTKAD